MIRVLVVFTSFTEIKPKDIVVLTRGQEEIIDFGIVTSDYEFHDVVKPSLPSSKKHCLVKSGTNYLHLNYLDRVYLL